MQSATTLSYVGLFPEIANLDANILKNLLKIEGVTETKPAIAVCHLDLPPGEVFRMPGTQYGIFIIVRKKDETHIRGVRTEREHGAGAHQRILQALKISIQVLGLEEPVIAEFRHRLVHAD